ncbi:hypothetical protein GCM10010156_52550 [Planobispora rosea]|uniref:Uncharacterized protein n=1 Tax=Planobispora rosea TaxID=35762 RepID=A0A8J3WFA5_PLARO|nr:hypothetical protein GCM10010156_52550 [Planobispora rosea]GIH86657.1 hypothetical protein Pro02_50650 [Planobispora rosea]
MNCGKDAEHDDWPTPVGWHVQNTTTKKHDRPHCESATGAVVCICTITAADLWRRDR